MSHGPDNSPLGRIMAMATGYWASASLSAAVQLGIFEAVDQTGIEGVTAQDLANQLDLSPHHTQALLCALAGLGLLAKDGSRYSVAPEMRAYLSPDGPACMLDALRFNIDMYPLWGRLPELVKAGEPVLPPGTHLGDDPQRTRRFVMGMHSRALALAPVLVPMIDLTDCQSLLDVASGPGTYSRCLLDQYPSMHVTQFDLPPVIAVAQTLAQAHPARDRIHYAPGDYHQDDLPGGFDAALYCGALHQESPQTAADTFTKLLASLKPGGWLYVVDMMLGEDGTQPVFSALFSLSMMLVNPIARVFRAVDAQDLLASAGFTELQRQTLPGSPYWVIRGRKPEA